MAIDWYAEKADEEVLTKGKVITSEMIPGKAAVNTLKNNLTTMIDRIKKYKWDTTTMPLADQQALMTELAKYEAILAEIIAQGF